MIYNVFVYRVAVSNEFYSKDFNKTLTLMTVTTAAIVLAIQANLVISLGMVGVLSIVRFRTAVKSSMNLFFLFWAISLGIICGAGLYLLAGMLSIVITVSVFLLDYMQSPVALSLLVVHCADVESGKQVEDIVKTSNCFARIKSKTVRKGNVEYIWETKRGKGTTLEDELNSLDGVLSFSLMSFDRETRV